MIKPLGGDFQRISRSSPDVRQIATDARGSCFSRKAGAELFTMIQADLR
jgi:hypothetical protein